MTLAETRQALVDTISPVYSGTVHAYPQDNSYSPPALVIERVGIEFPENSFLGITIWQFLMYEARTAMEGAVQQLELDLEAVLFVLRPGAHTQYVLRDVAEIDPVTSGLEFPGYQILGTTPFQNC